MGKYWDETNFNERDNTMNNRNNKFYKICICRRNETRKGVFIYVSEFLSIPI